MNGKLWMLLIGGAVVGWMAQAQTSENNARLKAALKRYPAADANKDGVLTMAEARAYKSRQQIDAVKEKPQPGMQGAERLVYKTVGDRKLTLYVYNPAGHNSEKKVPAIVFFHGGGWANGNPSQFEKQCQYLANRGMVAISVEYRLVGRGDVKVEDCIEDAKSAMRWVRGHAAELGVDPERIASGGGSAGGHLAACVAVIDDFNAKSDDLGISARPNAMVLFNPAVGGAADKLTSTKIAPKLRGAPEKAFPVTYASTKQGPCIMFFGTEDRLLAGAERFRGISTKAGNKCRIVTYEGQGHSFFNHRSGGNKYYDLTVAEMDAFLVTLGWLPSAPAK